MTDLRPLLEATFPIESDYFALTWVPDQEERPPTAAEDDVYVVLRLICMCIEGGERLIRDVKEQLVLLVPAESRHDPRLEAWLRGLREALLAVMQSQDPAVACDDEAAMYASNALACMLPMNLVQPEVLKLVRPRTAEDFTRALLRSRRRLGHMLFPPPRS